MQRRDPGGAQDVRANSERKGEKEPKASVEVARLLHKGLQLVRDRTLVSQLIDSLIAKNCFNYFLH